MQPLSPFLRASGLPAVAPTLPPVEAPTSVRFLTFLYWVLSLSYVSHVAVSYFSYLAVTIFSSGTHALSHAIFHFSYLISPTCFVGKTWLILLSVVLPSVVL